MNMISRNYRFSLKQKTMHGVTLIEMMISLTIGLLIIAGIGFAFLASRQGFRSQDALSRMQEGARTAFEIMDRDIRQAGFTGCPLNPAAAPAGDNNTLTGGTTTWYKNLYIQPLAGYDAITPTATPASASPAYPAGIALTGSSHVLRGDALTVLRADNSKEYIVNSHDSTTSQITLTANHDIKQGEILIAAKDDCSSTVVFQKTNTCTLTNGSCGDSIIQLGRDNTTIQLPINTIVSLNADSHPTTPPANSRIYRLSAVTYYVGYNPYGEPGLYREVLGTSGSAPVTSAEELIEGVQDMQLSYGIDTTGDGAVDNYVNATSLTTAAQWLQVLGIRISLLMVSRSDENGITTQPQQYALDMNGDGDTTDTGEAITDNTDHLLRKVFTTTIAVKNRL
jgi:type IV pilus assembly protein PilW